MPIHRFDLVFDRTILVHSYNFYTELHQALLAVRAPSGGVRSALSESKRVMDAIWRLLRALEAGASADRELARIWRELAKEGTTSVQSNQTGQGQRTWLAKLDAARFIDRSIKTLERYSRMGMIRKKLVRVAGRKPLPMFCKEDLQKLMER